MSVACQVNWASNFVVGFGWPYIDQAFGPYSFVPFGVLLLATFLFSWLYLPETAGRSVAQVQKAANQPKGRWGRVSRRGGPGDDRMAPAGNGMQYVVVEGVDLSLNSSP